MNSGVFLHRLQKAKRSYRRIGIYLSTVEGLCATIIQRYSVYLVSSDRGYRSWVPEEFVMRGFGEVHADECASMPVEAVPPELCSQVLTWVPHGLNRVTLSFFLWRLAAI